MRDIGAHLALQSRLVETGMLAPSALVDGVYGPIVRDAITRVQAQRSLPQTGLMSDATAAAITLASSATQAATASPTAAEEDAQRRTAERTQRLLAGQDDQQNTQEAETRQAEQARAERARQEQVQTDRLAADEKEARITRQLDSGPIKVLSRREVA